MRTRFGWLPFLLACGLAGGLLLSLLGYTWFGLSDDSAFAGTFGFGIPVIIAGVATAALWSGNSRLQKTLGWAGGLTGLACGISLFILVACWVFVRSPDTERAGRQFLGLAATMVVCGGFGIKMLLKSERK